MSLYEDYPKLVGRGWAPDFVDQLCIMLALHGLLDDDLDEQFIEDCSQAHNNRIAHRALQTEEK